MMKLNNILTKFETTINEVISRYNIDMNTAEDLKNQFNEFKNLFIHQEEILIEQEKMAMVGDLAASVAHEINTPLLAAIMSTSKLKNVIDEHYNENKPDTSTGFEASLFQKYFKMLESALSRIKQQSINLKSLIKYQDSSSVFNLIEEIESNLSLIGFMLNDVELEKNYNSNDIYLINGNAGQINQVIVNLIKNAVESLPEGRKGKLVISVYERDNKIILEITDNGMGIKPDNVQRLFIENFTTKKKGTGIGLKLCKDIIDRHNGTIKIESTEEVGSKFTIELNKYFGD